MDKRIILALAGAGKTYNLCHQIDDTKRNILLAYTNENIRNLKKEVIDKFGTIPDQTLILTFDSFLFRYFIRPYQKIIANKFKLKKFRTNGVDISNKPEPSYKNGKYNPMYRKKDNIEHFIINQKYYCSRIPELILYVDGLFDIAMKNINKYCDCIFIDEVQDFRNDYYKVLEKIIKNCNNIVMVGDYWQHSVNGNNNNGIPFKDTTYDKYIEKLKKIGLKVDDTSLVYSRRCSKDICNFVKRKLNIPIEAFDNTKKGKVIIVEDILEIINILENDDVIKLVNRDSKIYSFNSINWSYSKGNTYKDVCVILTDEYKNIDKEEFLLSKQSITNNQLYVALTRPTKNLYIIKKEKFDLVKKKFQK